MTTEIGETSGLGVGDQEGGLADVFLQNLERRKETLRRLDLSHHNYMLEIESLKEKLRKFPADVVRARRLAMIEKVLLPKIHDLIFQLEVARS